MKWLKNHLSDWLSFFEINKIQEALVFLTYITILLILGIIPIETYNMLAGLIIGGDALKKMGK